LGCGLVPNFEQVAVGNQHAETFALGRLAVDIYFAYPTLDIARLGALQLQWGVTANRYIRRQGVFDFYYVAALLEPRGVIGARKLSDDDVIANSGKPG
jgi:hypothetical protein